MSIRIMFKRCIHCGKKYNYDPSVGDFGMFCKCCKRVQIKSGLPAWEQGKHGPLGTGGRGA